MLLKSNNNVYKIPNIPQMGDYRYAKDLCCGCSQPNSFENWECDGVYDSNNLSKAVKFLGKMW